MQILPIGEQNFTEIRKNNWLYVDKTKHLQDMIKNGNYYFLSRPRRFGKSLTISTIEAMFQGKAELFKGLYAENWVKEQAKKPNPVIKLDMSPLGNYYKEEDLNNSMLNYFEIFLFLNDFNIPMKNNAENMFANIITKLYKQFGQVVVLIDEYDKPITDNIDDLEKAKAVRKYLRSFYSILKTYSSYLRFAFITGISKFSKVGIFSGLNNLKDISMTEKYSDIVGYTQKELEDNFSDWIEETALKKSIDKQELLDKIKKYYDGFSFDGKTRVYNPFSVLNFFDEG
ncbi:AAA family ATPase, partial [bacterium]|nr:AAA family ATPase [bacterium]